MTYVLGEVVTISTEVRVADVLTDPTTIALSIKLPDGSVSSISSGSIVHDGTGLYHYAYTPTTDGHFRYRWVTTGTAAGADEGEFDVAPAFGFADVLDVDAAKIHLDIETDDYDDELPGFIEAAEEIVAARARLVIAKTYTNEQHRPHGADLSLFHRPVQTVISAIEYVGTTAYTITEAATPAATAGSYAFTLDASAGILTRYAGGSVIPWQGPVYVTYTAGQSAMPAATRLATLAALRIIWTAEKGMGATEYPVAFTDANLETIDRLLSREALADGFA